VLRLIFVSAFLVEGASSTPYIFRRSRVMRARYRISGIKNVIYLIEEFAVTHPDSTSGSAAQYQEMVASAIAVDICISISGGRRIFDAVHLPQEQSHARQVPD
jgi:hypothetical protein